MRIWSLFLLGIILFSCGDSTIKNELKSDEVAMKYAQGFGIEKIGDFKVVTVYDAWRNNAEVQRYILYENEEPEGYGDAIKIKIPIKSIACMSLTHIAFLEKLGVENTIVAASGCRFSSSKKIKALVETKKIKEIGASEALNYEMLIEQSPDLVMAYGIDAGSIKYIDKLKSLKLNTVLNAEYMELHPLGKAEWLKFVAAFYAKDKQADSVFNYIEAEYLNHSSLTATIKRKPTVFVGMPWNGNWYVAGGKSFQAQLFKDAGVNYLWKDNDEKSSFIISKEIVFDEAFEADYWLNQNSYESVNSILKYDERLVNFSAIKNGNVYNNNNRLNKSSGNDYWESGTVSPQLILKDLIKIFHPNLIDHELHYYKKLE